MYTLELLEEKHGEKSSLGLTPDAHLTNKGLMNYSKFELLLSWMLSENEETNVEGTLASSVCGGAGSLALLSHPRCLANICLFPHLATSSS